MSEQSINDLSALIYNKRRECEYTVDRLIAVHDRSDAGYNYSTLYKNVMSQLQSNMYASLRMLEDIERMMREEIRMKENSKCE